MEFLAEGERTPEELVEFLKTGAMFRRFDQMLCRVYLGGDLAARLEREMIRISGEAPESVNRKVRNWVKGKHIPKNRETLFQICFALGLEEQSASWLIGTASETGIHYRNPKELVYAYGLRSGLVYQETVALYREIKKKFRQIRILHLPMRSRQDIKKFLIFRPEIRR